MGPVELRSSARFADRREAGCELGERLRGYAAERPVVVALPPGGVPVAREVALAWTLRWTCSLCAGWARRTTQIRHRRRGRGRDAGDLLRGPVLAVPVCAPGAARRLREIADDLVCLCAPTRLRGVDRWYGDFARVSEDEATGTLEELRNRLGGAPGRLLGPIDPKPAPRPAGRRKPLGGDEGGFGAAAVGNREVGGDSPRRRAG